MSSCDNQSLYDVTELGIISHFIGRVGLLSKSRDQEAFKLKSFSFSFDPERLTANANANASATVLTANHVKHFAVSL